MRNRLILASLVALSACDTPTPAANAAADTSLISEAVSDAPIPPAPQGHNYTEEAKGVYYYVGEVSENAKAQGVAAGHVSGFKFYGTTDDDQYILGIVDDDGRTIGKAYCNDPCVIVRPSIGSKFGAEATIIGAAFRDAIAGQLKKVKS